LQTVADLHDASHSTLPMKIRPLALFVLLLASFLPAIASDLAGKWVTQFDTQIGLQKYIFEFKRDGDKLTGQAVFDHSFGKGTVQLKDIKADGDKVSFKEPFSMEGNEITIAYSGTLTGDELKLTRQVGDIATEQLIAKRAPAGK
jgi:hypothetical protein